MAGASVTVFQRFWQNHLLERQGIPYHFVADRGPKSQLFLLPLSLHWQVAKLCRANLQQGIPTIVHLNGLLYPIQIQLLRSMLPACCPIIGQHHGSSPWAVGLRRTIQRWGLRGLAGCLFAAPALGQEWVKSGVIASSVLLHDVMEISSSLTYQPREEARALTRMYGNPIIFWAGNLNENKDPLTILTGFSRLLLRLPEARLYMAYRFDDLLPQVQAHITADSLLAKAVTLLGKIPSSHIGLYFNSADLFVQGSRKEAAGLALLDALACGVVPVVTAIPSFKVMTANGRLGALFPVGDADAFAEQVWQVWQRPLAPQSAQARQFFAENWSFTAIGRRSVAVYEAVWQQQQIQVR